MAEGITVIVPTVGRPSLRATLDSVLGQLGEWDSLTVAWDRPLSRDPFAEMAEWDDPAVDWFFPKNPPLGGYGHAARNAVLDIEDGSGFGGGYFYSIDDDDVVVPGAIAAMHKAVAEHPGRWFVFQMVGGANSHFPGRVVPAAGHEIRPGNVGTPMLLWPTCKARFGVNERVEGARRYDAGYFGDYEMAEALQQELGDPVWVDTPVAAVRP